VLIACDLFVLSLSKFSCAIFCQHYFVLPQVKFSLEKQHLARKNLCYCSSYLSPLDLIS
jgi:hypothetical protein